MQAKPVVTGEVWVRVVSPDNKRYSRAEKCKAGSTDTEVAGYLILYPSSKEDLFDAGGYSRME